METRIVLIIFLCIGGFGIASENVHETKSCTEVARDEETLLVFSTLGGGLTAIDPMTSEIRWQIDDEPAIKVPTPNEFSIPQYLPDPRDGSLYQLGGMGGLKKLPYTIPQLVASAPCRSSDGILYSGKKSDAWFLIDPKTGRREKVVGFGSPSSEDSIGWATSRGIYLGRTQYTVLMYDSQTKEKNTLPWNVTFFDYSSISMEPELYKSYEFLHLTSSSSGLTALLDREKGSLMWQKDLKSPVVAVFLLGNEGLLNIPFTTLSEDSLRNVVEFARDGTRNDFNLFQTLYVGEHSNGLYAIPSLVDHTTATISSDPPVKLLGGPLNQNDVNSQNLVHLNNILAPKNGNNIIVLGYYQPPIEKDVKLTFASNGVPTHSTAVSEKPSPSGSDTGSEMKDLANIVNFPGYDRKPTTTNDTQKVIETPQEVDDGDENELNKVIPKMSKEFIALVYKRVRDFIDDQENRILKLLLVISLAMMLGLFWYTRNAVRELRQSQSGSNSFGNRSSDGSYRELEDMGAGEYKIGKICFNPTEVIGKGCEGTFVFKGTFEKRAVAVKRLLPECFTLADREVSLLRESDTHENVVRYFCTEQDRQFKYIAVELCAATLQDYTEGIRSKDLKKQIGEIEVLKQATKGLIHLHSLNIVHRDIKPQNVLLSFPDNRNRIRVMISDFGLCKKLNVGKASFSRRSGVTGTEGWIAPEMIKGHRTTTSVDIFSLGCVFYYVLTKGSHPFGESMKRQANILSNDFDLRMLNINNLDYLEILAEQLIREMINRNPMLRPPAAAIRTHPLFWSEEKILAFLQDVSDRVEKTNIAFVEPLRCLEKNAKFVVRDDWNMHLDYTVTADMKKYRGYQGGSVRDLLRAIRNKKHHYHELDAEIQQALGSLPLEFTRYWLKRFPHLLTHSYHALEICSKDVALKTYYPNNFTFTHPEYFDRPGSEESFEALMANMKNSSPKKVPSSEKRDNNNQGKSNYNYNKSNNKNNNEMRNRKGAYNFHKTNEPNGAVGGGELSTAVVQTEDFRAFRKNYTKKRNSNENNNDDVPWTINK